MNDDYGDYKANWGDFTTRLIQMSDLTISIYFIENQIIFLIVAWAGLKSSGSGRVGLSDW